MEGEDAERKGVSGMMVRTYQVSGNYINLLYFVLCIFPQLNPIDIKLLLRILFL